MFDYLELQGVKMYAIQAGLRRRVLPPAVATRMRVIIEDA